MTRIMDILALDALLQHDNISEILQSSNEVIFSLDAVHYPTSLRFDFDFM